MRSPVAPKDHNDARLRDRPRGEAFAERVGGRLLGRLHHLFRRLHRSAPPWVRQNRRCAGAAVREAARFWLNNRVAATHLFRRRMTTGYWNDLSLARKGIIVALLPVVCLLVGFASLYAVSVAERRAQARRRSHSGGSKSNRHRSGRHRYRRILGARFCHRRAIRNSESDLADAREQVTKALARLAALTVDNPSQQARLEPRSVNFSASAYPSLTRSWHGRGDRYLRLTPSLARLVTNGKAQDRGAARHACRRWRAKSRALTPNGPLRSSRFGMSISRPWRRRSRFGIGGGFVSIFSIEPLHGAPHPVHWRKRPASGGRASLAGNPCGQGRNRAA